MKYLVRKYIVLIPLLGSFGYINCIGQETQKANNDSVEIWIKEIKKEYDRINNDTSKFRVERKNIFGQSSEGGLSENFYDGKTLRKAVMTLFGETGKSADEYYFVNGEIIFVLQTEVRYKSPIYMGKTEIKNREENRFYFNKKKLIRWISKDGKIMDAGLYPEKEKEILDDFKNIH